MQIASLVTICNVIGTNRIVKGVGIPYPLGDPEVTRIEGKKIRRKIVEKALQLLAKDISQQEAA